MPKKASAALAAELCRRLSTRVTPRGSGDFFSTASFWPYTIPERPPVGAPLLNSQPMLDRAFDTMKAGGTCIVPTNVGYTIFAMDGAQQADRLDEVKGRASGKPFGICGTDRVFEHIFGYAPPELKDDDLMLSFMGKPEMAQAVRRQLEACRTIGPAGEVAVWINGGYVMTYLADRAIDELGKRILIASSCNDSGEGNPTAKAFSLDALSPAVRSSVDFEIDLPHWSKPEFDNEGRWLSAPIFDLEEHRFFRRGKHMRQAEMVVSALTCAPSGRGRGEANVDRN